MKITIIKQADKRKVTPLDYKTEEYKSLDEVWENDRKLGYVVQGIPASAQKASIQLDGKYDVTWIHYSRDDK